MGRELRRVPVNFDWPLHKRWDGFMNPFYEENIKCKSCDGSGYTPEAKMLHDLWYGYLPFHPIINGSKPVPPTHPKIVALAKRNVTEGIIWAFDHECRRLADECINNHWSHHLDQCDVNALVESGRLGNLLTPVRASDVNEAYMFGIGHDSINSHVCIEARCKRYGWETTCKKCGGDGAVWSSPEAEKACEEWEETPPPTGDGYQLWETVSEGSPVTPVFVTPEELADWLVANDTSVTKGTTREQWLKFINCPGWSPSMVGDANGFRPGVQAVI